MDKAAQWFHDKWNVPVEAYQKCMESYLKCETEYGWYLCLDVDQIFIRTQGHHKTGHHWHHFGKRKNYGHQK